jgi:hypothetical protein
MEPPPQARGPRLPGALHAIQVRPFEKRVSRSTQVTSNLRPCACDASKPLLFSRSSITIVPRAWWNGGSSLVKKREATSGVLE